MAFALVCVVAAMSFADIIRGPPGKKVEATGSKRYRNERYEIDGQLALGERACAFIFSSHGEESVELLFDALAKRRTCAAQKKRYVR